MTELFEDPALVSKIKQVGHVFWWPHASVPSYALAIDGSAISRTVYGELFAEIGTTWGVGDGATTFNLPDVDDGETLVQANANEGTKTVGQVIAHSHGSSIFQNGTSFQLTSGVGSLHSQNSSGSTGGASNKAAGARGRFCIIY